MFILDYDDLTQKIKDLEIEFSKLVQCLASYMEETQPNSRKLLNILKLLPNHLGRLYTPLLNDTLKPKESILDIFSRIHSAVWNFLDYHILEYLIDEFGTENLKDKMEYYAAKIVSFKKDTEVIPFIECWDGKINDIPHYVEIQAKHDVVNMKLAQLDRFRRDFIKQPKGKTLPILSHYAIAMYRKNIEKGCVCVSWCLHESLWSIFNNAISNYEDIFRDYNIIWIKHNGNILYQSKDKHHEGK